MHQGVVYAARLSLARARDGLLGAVTLLDRSRYICIRATRHTDTSTSFYASAIIRSREVSEEESFTQTRGSVSSFLRVDRLLRAPPPPPPPLCSFRFVKGLNLPITCRHNSLIHLCQWGNPFKEVFLFA